MNVDDMTWYKKDADTKWLFSNGFVYDDYYSDSDGDAYVYAFPIYEEYNKKYDCLIILYLDTGEVFTKIVYAGTRLSSDNTYYKHKSKMDKVIIEKFKEFGIDHLR